MANPGRGSAHRAPEREVVFEERASATADDQIRDRRMAAHYLQAAAASSDSNLQRSLRRRAARLLLRHVHT